MLWSSAPAWVGAWSPSGKVAIVDELPYGGTCPLRGCDPKKVLTGAAEVLDWERRMQGAGLRAAETGIDWRELMRFKRTFTEPFPEYREQSFRQEGITTLHGTAAFTGPSSVQVGSDLFEADHIVIATGAEPMKLGFEGEQHLLRSDQFLDVDELPDDVAFLGGGYISFEFAHVAARAGARVHIIEAMARPLHHFDEELAERVVLASRELGIDLQVGVRVERIIRAGQGFTVHGQRDGQHWELTTGAVVHGAGRVPRLGPLNLAAGRVEHTSKGITVNEYLQSTSNPRVYAVGDVLTSGPQLTPVAEMHGRIAAANLLDGNRHPVPTRGIPSVLFTIPPAASVGLTEQQARAEKLDFVVHRQDTSGWYTARRVRQATAAFKVLVEAGTDRILGAHLIGPNADEVANVFAVAIQAGLKAPRLEEMVLAYPTAGADVAYML